MVKKKKQKNEKAKIRVMNKKKIVKVGSLIVVIILLLITTMTLVFNYLSNKDPFQDKKNRSVVSIGIYDYGTYFISKAEKDIKFPIKSNDTKSYKLTTSNNKTVKSKIVKEHEKNYIKALENYHEGDIYFLELTDTKFDDNLLKKTNKIEFKIAEPEKKKYTFSNDVVEIDKKYLKQQSANKLKVDSKVKENQIILVKDKENINNAYKVTTVSGNIATIENANVNEIYDELDVYKEGYVDFNNIIFNKDIKERISKSIKNSALFSFLAYDVYAAEKTSEPKITFKTSGDSITIEIELNFKPNGEKKLGVEALKKHELTIKLSYDISIKYQSDVELGKIIALDTAVANKTSFEIEIKNGDEYLKGIEEISDAEYSKSVEEIVKKLQKEVPDVSENSIDIGAIEIPTGVPGLNIFMDIYFQNQLSVIVNFEAGVNYETVEHVGFVIDKNGQRAYKNITESNFTSFVKVTGKEEIRIGIGLDAGICIINKDLASASMGIEFGAYQEAFSTFNLQYESKNNNINRDLVAKLELGVYLKAKVSANVDALFIKVDLKYDLAEFKYPVLRYGKDEIITGLSSKEVVLVLDNNNRVKIPEISKTILNLDTTRTRNEACNLKSLYFEDSNGTRLKNDSNHIELGKNENTKIYAVYESNHNKYKVMLSVLEQGTPLATTNNPNSTYDLGVSGDRLGSISIDTNTTAINSYKKYILEKKYISDYQKYFKENDFNMTSLYNVGYIIYDLNRDGVPELIINDSFEKQSSEWFIDMIYTFDGTSVKKVDSIYNYMGIKYNPSTQEIVYTEIRPTYVVGAYSFYKLINDKFIYTKSVGHDRGYFDVYTGKYEYDKHFYSDPKTTLKEISEKEEQAYFKDIVSFSYQNINNVR